MPLEVAQVARAHFKLQNTIHWVKSIAIDREAAGQAPASTATWRSATTSRSTATGSSTTATSSSFTSRRTGRTPLDRRAVGVPYQDQSNVKRWAAAGDGLRCRGNTWFIPYETIQSRDRDRPPPRVPRPGEPLWSLRKDHNTWSAELRYHGEWGVEAQLLRDGELVIGRGSTCESSRRAGRRT